MSSTIFPTVPGDVAVLTAGEFTFELEWNNAASLEEVCRSGETVTSCGPSCWATPARGTLRSVYEAGRVDADRFVSARWDLLPHGRYLWASVQTVRGCPKHCSFCSVWRTDGQAPRQRHTDVVLDEVLELRRRGFRFAALADDNFLPRDAERSCSRRAPR